MREGADGAKGLKVLRSEVLEVPGCVRLSGVSVSANPRASARRPRSRCAASAGRPGDRCGASGVLDQLTALSAAGWELTLPNGDQLKVTSPSKPYWPKPEAKGDLLRYYVEVCHFAAVVGIVIW